MRIPISWQPRQAFALYPVETVRAMDSAAIQRLGDSGAYTLMTRAAQGAFDLLQQRWPMATRLHIVCGGGNNGGDGYVLARLAKAHGLEVVVSRLSDVLETEGPAYQALEDARQAGVRLGAVGELSPVEPDVWVDALVGTGFSGAPRGDLAAWIDRLNNSGASTLALDVPSGLNANTGCAAGGVVKADVTVSFVAMKRGLVTGRGPAVCGDLWLDDLSIDGAVFSRFPAEAWLRSWGQPDLRLPERSKDAHKGRFGRALVVGGDYGFGGAVILAAGSAARSGAGSVQCATRDGHVQPGLVCYPDIMFTAVANRSELLARMQGADALCLGPGLGKGAWGQMCFQVARECELPLVLDADGLNLLATRPDSTWASEQRVLTPHPGEAARLLGKSVDAVETDRFAAVTELADRYRAVCLLKGAGTLIASPESETESRRLAVIRGGNPGMASAGMGDVLAGLIGGLMAQGFSAFDAACTGAAWHATSGDRCRDRLGENALMASDVCTELSQVALEQGVL